MSWDMLPDLAWKSAVVLGVTLGLLHLFRSRSAAQRAWIAHIGLAATLLLPLATALLPRWEVAVAPVAGLAAPVRTIFETPVAADAAAPALAAAAAPVPEASAPWMPDAATLIASAWGLPALLLLLVMLVAVARLFALARRASVLAEQSWLVALAQAQARMNFKHGTALLVSREIASPVSWGVLRPVILLSEAAVENRGDAEAIIAHELAHVSRLDWAGLLLGRIVTALFWFNPLAWMLAAQAHQLREEAADDAVLRSNVDRMEYAALLVGAARHQARGFLLAANGVAPSAGSLKRRITRVLDEHQLRAPAYLGWMSACAAGAAVLALPLAAFSATHPEMVREVQAALTPSPAPVVAVAATVTPPAPVAQVPPAPVTPRAPRPVPTPPAPPAPPQQQVTVDVPGVLIQSGPDRVTVDVPGVFIQTTPQTVTVDIPALSGIRIAADQRRTEADSREARTAAGEDKPTADDLIQMAVLGIEPGYRRAIAEAGYPNLRTSELHQLRVHGVTAPWLRDLAAAGYDRLSLKQITNFAVHHVDADFARRMADASAARPTPEQLVQLRIFNGRLPGAPRQQE